MATMAFDTLRYARRLQEAGVPEPQAEVQAELMAEAFGFYADNLLTKDHFNDVINSRFAEQDARIDKKFVEQDAKLEKRFAEQDAKFEKRFAEQDAKLEKRFAEQDAKFDLRFAEQDAKIEKRFAEQDAKFDLRFAEVRGVLKLHSWMFGLIMLALVVPQLVEWFG